MRAAARTRLAVIGHPIAHSLSPVMHRAALDALGRADVSYEALDVATEALEETLGRLADEGFVGLNVTSPHKTAVLAHLAGVEPSARRIGATNTLLATERGWIGTNTDATGLERALDEARVRVRGARAVVLGAGGAARAAVIALSESAEVVVVARRLDAAKQVAALHPRGRAETFGRDAALAGAEVLVQATSATLGPEAASFAASLALGRLAPGAVVVDLVYRPRETALLARARALGLGTVDGVGMLVHQGAASLERWMGCSPPVAAMRSAVLAALEG